MKPAGSSELRDRFHDALAKAVKPAGDVPSGEQVRSRLSATPDLLNCAGGPCVTRTATLLRADRVVVPTVEVEGKNYTVKLKIFDNTGAEAGVVEEERCEICTVKEAAKSVERLGERSVAVLQAPAAVTPVAARVPQVDDDPGMRPSPTRNEPVTSTIQPAPAPPQPIQPAPLPPPPPPVVAQPEPPPVGPMLPPPPVAVQPAPVAVAPQPADSSSGVPYRGLAIGAFALGAVALAGTIAWGVYASKDGNYLNSDGSTCTAADPKHNCPKQFSGNTAGAAVSGVVAVAAIGAGALLLYLDHKHKKPGAPTVMALPTRDGFAASAAFEF